MAGFGVSLASGRGWNGKRAMQASPVSLPQPVNVPDSLLGLCSLGSEIGSNTFREIFMQRGALSLPSTPNQPDDAGDTHTLETGVCISLVVEPPTLLTAPVNNSGGDPAPTTAAMQPPVIQPDHGTMDSFGSPEAPQNGEILNRTPETVSPNPEMLAPTRPSGAQPGQSAQPNMETNSVSTVVADQAADSPASRTPQLGIDGGPPFSTSANSFLRNQTRPLTSFESADSFQRTTVVEPAVTRPVRYQIAAPGNAQVSTEEAASSLRGTGRQPSFESALPPGAAANREGGNDSALALEAMGSASITLERPAVLHTPTLSQASPPAPPESSALLEQTVRGVRFLVDRDGGSVRINLDPPGLGFLRIRLDLSENRAEAWIEVASRSTHELLQQNSAQLHRSLEHHGIHLESLIIRPETQNGPHTWSQSFGGSEDGTGTGSEQPNPQAVQEETPATDQSIENGEVQAVGHSYGLSGWDLFA